MWPLYVAVGIVTFLFGTRLFIKFTSGRFDMSSVDLRDKTIVITGATAGE